MRKGIRSARMAGRQQKAPQGYLPARANASEQTVVIMQVEIPGMRMMDLDGLRATVEPILQTQLWFLKVMVQMMVYFAEERIVLFFYPQEGVGLKTEVADLADRFLEKLGEVEILVSYCTQADINRQIMAKNQAMLREYLDSSPSPDNPYLS